MENVTRRSFFGLTLGGILAALCPWRRPEPTAMDVHRKFTEVLRENLNHGRYKVGNHAEKLIVDDVISEEFGTIRWQANYKIADWPKGSPESKRLIKFYNGT